MRRKKWNIYLAIVFAFLACSKSNDSQTGTPPPPAADTSLVNTAHLDDLNVAVTFDNGDKTTGLYIYSNAPSYSPAYAEGEGFTCVDDVARGALYYIRSPRFSGDEAIREKAYGFISFVLNMQSGNGYFYNFVQTGNIINKYGQTSINLPKWWSWRALQALTEGVGVIRPGNAALAAKMDQAIDKLITAIKTDLAGQPLTTISVDGIAIPQWLPEGADQAATLLLGLVPYCRTTGDAAVKAYIKKLADGIVASQSGGAGQSPYGAFLSSGTSWHAYGNDQSHALFTAASFLNDNTYSTHAMLEVDNFYTWLLNNGFLSSFQVKMTGSVLSMYNQQQYEQIAYGIRPMVSAAIDAYVHTGDEKYADMAGKIASWLLGNNTASATMYSLSNGICFDAIATGNTVNRNSGAESTLEALLTMQAVTNYPTVKAALLKYKK